MKVLCRCMLMLLLFSQVVNAQNENEILDKLVERAILLSPKVKAFAIQRDITEEKIPQFSNLPDPVLNLGLMNLPVNSFSFSQEPMTGKLIGISQSFPFPGKLESVKSVFGKDVQISNDQIIESKNEVRRDFLNNFYDLRSVRKSLEISKQNKQLLDQIENVVRTKYTVSTASQSSLMKILLQSSHIDEQIEELSAREKSIASVLNSFLFQSPESEIITCDSIAMNFLNLNSDSLISLARTHRPSLQAIFKSIEKAKLAGASAKYDYLPNFNVSLQYSQRDRLAKANTNLDDFFSMMVGISLPLNYGGKISSKVNESELMQNMMEQQYAAAIQTLTGEFNASVIKINSLKKRIEIFSNGLYPQSVQGYNSALAGYQVGQIDFMNVIDAQMKLLDIQNTTVKLETEYLKEINKLEFLTGIKLN